jgi:hypothetical protein
MCCMPEWHKSAGGGGGLLQTIWRPGNETVYLSQPMVEIKTAWSYACTSSRSGVELSTGKPLLSIGDIDSVFITFAIKVSVCFPVNK